jgi:uncharacterized protein YccT (UPF0319 family)
MHLKRFLILACAMLLAACTVEPIRSYNGNPKPADQVARVIVPGAVSLDSIDAKSFSSPPDETRTYEIELLPGRHVLVFRYVALWGPHDSSALVTSNYASFDASFSAGQTYRLEYEVPKDEYDAIELKNSFKPVLLLSGTNQKLASRQLYGSAALRQSLAEMNAQATVPTMAQVSNPVVDVNKLEPTKQSTEPAQPLPSADTAVKEDTVKRLKFWWLMSNESEREEFKRWMKTVDESFSEQNPVKQE